MGLKEIYNSENPQVVLTPMDGIYILSLANSEVEGNGLSIGICFSAEHGWGYWDYDQTRDEKEWVTIDVPESNPDLVKRAK